MKKIYFLVALLLFTQFVVEAQTFRSHTSRPAKSVELKRQRSNANLPFEEALAPFYHGVASGDPLQDRVIIWTRVTPEAESEEDIEVTWYISDSTSFLNLVATGTFTTNAARDYTVKVDVTDLTPGTTYYYYFSALGKNSLIGKTKTAPEGDTDQLKFAVVSCNNYEAGYFNGFGRIADRTDLDAVIHLGDYIYEYENGFYGVDDPNRAHIPDTEILTLADYRTRYSLYRLDPDLRRAHQQHAFITVWDDHESANDAYKDGAENHNEGEGSWEDRKSISKQVYNEWMPIREAETQPLYRTINYGNLMDLIMVDTRLEGREQQINDVTDASMYAASRTLLGTTQREWFLDQLSNATAQWKVVGNQVIFSDFNVWWANDPEDPTTSAVGLESTFVDIWDGYPAERRAILDHIEEEEIDNVIFLTGDFHCSFGFDVAKEPVGLSGGNIAASVADNVPVPVTPTYNPEDGSGSLAIEFATPSICSANFDENLATDLGDPALGLATAQGFQVQINNPLSAPGTPVDGVNPNPHMKYVNLIDHGYFILDLQSDKAQADWYLVNTVLEPSTQESRSKSLFSDAGENHLQESDSESTPKAQQDTPAPNRPLLITNLTEETTKDLAVMSIYPNPTTGLVLMNYVLNKKETITIELRDTQGKRLELLLNEQQNRGNYAFTYDAVHLENGIYVLSLHTSRGTVTRKLVVSK